MTFFYPDELNNFFFMIKIMKIAKSELLNFILWLCCVATRDRDKSILKECE